MVATTAVHIEVSTVKMKGFRFFDGGMIEICQRTNRRVMKTVFLFPGQGSQRSGMLRNLPQEEAIIFDVFTEARGMLGTDPAGLDTEENLRSTVWAQICILISSVISARRLQARGVMPDFVAGHSVGAFSAAVISGVLSFGDALSLVHVRSSLMEKAYPCDYGMAALVGISEKRLGTVLDNFKQTHGTVWLSNINSADQQVVAGRTEDLLSLIRQLQITGIHKAKLLDVAVPSHCPLMSRVSDALKELMRAVEWKKPTVQYGANSTGRVTQETEDIRKDLYANVSATVRWYDLTTAIYESGGSAFIEMEPSGVLTKIAAKTFPEAKIITVGGGDPEATAWLWNQYKNESIT